MIESLVASMQSMIETYGAWGVFLATVIEEMIAPIPSAIVPLAAGFFLLPADLSIEIALLKGAVFIASPVTMGISLGSSLVYAIGFFGGKPLIEKSQRWLGIGWQDIERIERRVIGGSKDEITLFFLRLLPFIPGVAISGFCGIVRYPLYRFLIVTVCGSFLRAFILGLVGWQVGTLYTVYAAALTRLEKYLFAGFIVCAVIVAGWFFYVKKTRKNKMQDV